DTVRDDIADLTTRNASDVVNTPAGDIVATNVQTAINELDTEKLSSTVLARGTSTITSGNQTVVVNHTLSGTPYITCKGNSTYGTGNWIDTKTATQFTINIDAPQPVNIDFDWIAML
ncbi:MAG: hypothetical protein KJ888_20290, partial [Gammaproteobacteria bacterium]|nr:hypothetical protein [Gammaproteobacteria bacterium]